MEQSTRYGYEDLSIDFDITGPDAQVDITARRSSPAPSTASDWSAVNLDEYFRIVEDDPNVYECVICNALVSADSQNLTLHVREVHKQGGKHEPEEGKRGRPKRSFIWKYCTRRNDKQAFCHLCHRLLYFGGGNTSNITKHLRRKHSDVINNKRRYKMDHIAAMNSLADIELQEELMANRRVSGSDQGHITTRKGSSYVWNHCKRVARDRVSCTLCKKIMNFHGTANLITHLQRKHNISGKQDASAPLTIAYSIGKKDDVRTIHPPHIGNSSKQISASTVWLHCRRLNKEEVMCNVCKKKLSYQGTSNLQRHLHRMHGIVTSLRNHPSTLPLLESHDILTHSIIDDGLMHCKLCEFNYSTPDPNEMNSHLVEKHGVLATDSSPIDVGPFVPCDFEHEWPSLSDIEIVSNDGDFKVETQKSADDIEQPQENNDNDVEDVVLFEGQYVPSRENSIPPPEAVEIANTYADSVPVVPVDDKYSAEWKELSLRCKRNESDYYQEKAGFYRMQIYLSAMHVNKMKRESQETESITSQNGQYIMTNGMQPDPTATVFAAINLDELDENTS